MNKFIMLLVLLVINCGGKDGENGAPGKNGKDGKDGLNGIDGRDGTDNKIVNTTYCSGSLSQTDGSANGLSLPIGGLYFTYNTNQTTSGDVFVAASISDRYYQVSNSKQFAETQEGSVTRAISMTDDRVLPYNGGWWSFEYSAAVEDIVVTYHDTDLSSDKSFTFYTCTTQEF